MDTDDGKPHEGSQNGDTSEAQRPALPTRPSNLSLIRSRQSSINGRPGLISGATTAVSMTDINSYTRPDGSKELRASPARNVSHTVNSRLSSSRNSDTNDDTFSIRSDVPQAKSHFDDESIFGAIHCKSTDHSRPSSIVSQFQHSFERDTDSQEVDFAVEFENVNAEIIGEDVAHAAWKAKKKHFIILSAAGKPIYSRHGSDNIISSHVGVIQTIISTYQAWNNQLRSFTAGDVQFVILSQTNMFLVAISSLPESETQLKVQLEALYMQILSTLTLPTLTHLFSVRPSTDLRRPLQGTEVLLSALADSFTHGSPSTLLSALECLRIRKSHREVINKTFIRARVDDLLYGLIVAGGRLVSVIRPKKHSLHPSDLHLIFNMLFEADGIKAGGGDSWIPICLPGFNRTGYLHMYVSFLATSNEAVRELENDEHIEKEDAVAIILLSTNKESFEDMLSMKNYMVRELTKNGSLKVIQNAVRVGRPALTDIDPRTVLRHFIYKSKGNVQFFMPSYSPHYETRDRRRTLMSLYHIMHANVHAKHAAVKVQHIVASNHSALAWVTPMFELYCIGSPTSSRNALAQGANRVVQWIQREEERVFLIGGAVF